MITYHKRDRSLVALSLASVPCKLLKPLEITLCRSTRLRIAPKSHANYVPINYLESSVGIIEEREEPMLFE